MGMANRPWEPRSLAEFWGRQQGLIFRYYFHHKSCRAGLKITRVGRMGRAIRDVSPKRCREKRGGYDLLPIKGSQDMVDGEGLLRAINGCTAGAAVPCCIKKSRSSMHCGISGLEAWR